MKTLLFATLMVTLLAVSTAFAEDPRPMQPVRGSEGPDVRHTVIQPQILSMTGSDPQFAS
jgi:hypothetical protein